MGWIIQNNKLTNTDFVNLPSAPFHDYPLMFWRINQDINNGMPYIPLMLDIPESAPNGAFENATYLKKVVIPKSCKSIGAKAFAGTLLTSVTIASDCTYSETSFPNGCVVNFYPD